MNKAFLSGDEAIARGAYEAGVKVAAAYPGTPSTEILETVSQYEEIYSEWSVNEKVALEVALGASMAGVRALYASKHVGVNVAADPLFSAAYIGSRGGLVIVTADDPGLHSSQNEQDNRNYGKSARIPVLSPSDSQEAKDFTILAFDISEMFDVPVIIRITTRIAHSKTVVSLGDRKEVEDKGYIKDVSKNLILPQFAKKRHYSLEERINKLAQFAETTPINTEIEGKDKTIGFISDGVAFQYVREAFPEAGVLKLGMSYPLPEQKIRNFVSKYKKVYIVEENDPFLEHLIKSMGLEVIGKEVIPTVDELSPDIIKQSITGYKTNLLKMDIDIPSRPPALCPGCGHRTVFYVLSRMKTIITGDIGCYTLGALPPLNAMDTCVDMGASITIAHGIDKALQKKDKRKIVGVIGDSTFFHSGITGLIDIVYNKGISTIVILDNSITAMTGHQTHPGVGEDIKGAPAPIVDIKALVHAAGVKHVWDVDAYDYKKVKDALKQATSIDEPSVVIARRPCALYIKLNNGAYVVEKDKCIGCKICVDIGCPAISFDTDTKKAYINEFLCVGCDLCAQVCPVEAIHAKNN